jgi:DNA polymerase I-like protein with 3'-5' exonuclease and polymerase domains
MQAPEVLAIDFETFPIAQRPKYPPKPVGVAIKWPGEPGHYYAWGHPTKNNCTEAEGKAALLEAWHSGIRLLFHNSKFDVSVACEGMGLEMPPWDMIDDTMFLAYLADPHSKSGGLKELAEDLLGWAPEERDAVKEWIMARKIVLFQTYGATMGLKQPTPSKTGAWIFSAPGDLVGEYAVGDVDRTAGLWEHLWPLIAEAGLLPAYDTERELMPILLANERDGMRCDVEGLRRDIPLYAAAFAKAEAWLRTELRATGLNFDADADVADILFERGIVPAENWKRTKGTKTHPNGQLAMNKEDLRPDAFTGPNGAAIASALGYRNRLATCLNMFMRPWLLQAELYNGHITTNWNQVRQPNGGTRTGRPSTDKHNFLNISKDFEGRTDGYVHPVFLDVPPLPLCRKYVLPDTGEVFIHRDFSGQELRVFAHFEQGQLWSAYQADPRIDPHAIVGSEMTRLMGQEFERTKVKVLNFQAIYGGGAPAAQNKLNCSLAEAKEFKKFHEQAMPGRKILSEEILRVVRRGDPIITLGGRMYYAEPPRFMKELGRVQTFEYKLINYIVQGSAADLTKRAIIDWHNHPKRIARFMVTVYDEINASAPTGDTERQMTILRECMEAQRLGLTVAMLSDGKMGPNWGDLKKCA